MSISPEIENLKISNGFFGITDFKKKLSFNFSPSQAEYSDHSGNFSLFGNFL